MAIQYKVVELKGQSDPRSSGETPEVTAEAIETALNQQGRDNWELFTILERFTETSHTEETALCRNRLILTAVLRAHRCDPHLQEGHGVTFRLPRNATSHRIERWTSALRC